MNTTSKILVVDSSDRLDAWFNEPLNDAVRQLPGFETDVINYTDLAPHEQPDGYAAIVISGVPRTYSFDTIKERSKHLRWIKHTDKPVLGICLGHQAIGKIFGSEIRDDEAEYGMTPVNVSHQEDPIFAGLDPTIMADMMHRASITLPKRFTLLASSAGCDVVAMKHRSRPIYGFQFHPEAPENQNTLSSQHGATLLGNFATLAAGMAQSIPAANETTLVGFLDEGPSDSPSLQPA